MSPIERLDRLTPGQRAQLPAIRERWTAIGFSTERADRSGAEAAARLAYRRAGLSEPESFVWVGSPMAGAARAALLSRSGSRRQPTRTATEVRSRVACEVTSRVADQVTGDLSRQVWNEVASGLAGQLGEVWSLVRDHIEQEIGSEVESGGYGQHDAHWIAFYDALRQLGIDVSPLDGLTGIAASCGWWWPFERTCILAERHTVLARDERGRLHSPDGPALAYPDGSLVYAWHGVSVRPETVLHPEAITVAEIQHEAEPRVRRVLLARYAINRYVADSGALPIHADDTGTLYRCEMDGDEPLVVVSVMNSTPEPDASQKRYFLRVPPDITTAREAIAWTFDRRADEYRPVFET